MNKNYKITILASLAAIAVAAGFFWYFGGFKEKAVEENSLTVNSFENVEVLGEVDYKDETIPLLWTDNNDNENLIIKTDRQYYDAKSETEVFFSVSNTTSNEQKTDIYFWFDGGDKKVEKVEKIENGSENPKFEIRNSKQIQNSKLQIQNRKDIKGYNSGDYFEDIIVAGQTNYYRAVIKFPKGASGEFFIEAIGDKNSYGHLDPYYTSGLVGMWSFNGQDTNWSSATAGTTADKSGNNNTGTMTNMSRSTSPVPGISGQALSFDGVDDRVMVGSDLLGTGAISISAWIYATAYARRIVTNSGGGTDFLVESGTKTLLLYSTSNTRAANNAISLNQWYHVIVTRDANHLVNFYINGMSSGTANQDCGVPASGATETAIGASPSGSSPFNGTIDEVRVYNRALSASEITDLYRLGAARLKVNTPLSGRFKDSSLVGYWSFDGKDMGTTSATDLSGRAVTGWLISGVKKVLGLNGQGLNFSGTDDYVDVGNVYNGVKTVSFWLKADTGATRKVIDLNSTMYIDVTSGVIATNGFTGTIYVDGVAVAGSTATVDNNWHFVTVTIDAGLNADAVALGKAAAACPGTFGTTSVGGSQHYIGDVAVCGRYQNLSGCTGTLQKISYYIDTDTTTANLKVAIYSDNAGDPDVVLGTSSEVNPSAYASAWYDFSSNDLTSVAIVNNNYYWLCVNGGVDMVGARETTGGEHTSVNHVYDGSFPAGNTYVGDGVNLISIHADVQ